MTEHEFESYLARVLHALDEMGHTDVHMGGSLRDKTFELTMDVEASTVDEAQARFAGIVEEAVRRARTDVAAGRV